MTFCKIIFHDLRCGLLQKKYLVTIIISLICLWPFVSATKNLKLEGTWMDMILYLFRGCMPISHGERSRMPLLWLFLVNGCLFLNLEYPLTDLTQNGVQVIYRYHNRKLWYLSKCLWNLSSTFMYFFLLIVVVSILSFVIGIQFRAVPSPDWKMFLFDNPDVEIIDSTAIIAGLCMPYLSLAALNLLQMTLCLFIKPVLSFVFCVGIIILGVYFNYPWILGNGAMALRTVTSNHRNVTIILAIITAGVCIVGGTLRFCHMDILPGDESV